MHSQEPPGMCSSFPAGMTPLETAEDTVVFELTPGDGPTLAVAVATAVATVLDVEATSLSPLARTIDPEYVQAVIASAVDATVSFTYEDCRVVVDTADRLEVTA